MTVPCPLLGVLCPPWCLVCGHLLHGAQHKADAVTFPARCSVPHGARTTSFLCPVPWPPRGLGRVNSLGGTAPPGWSQPRELFLQDRFLPLGPGQAHSDHPMGLRLHLVWITPRLVTLPFPVCVHWPQIPLATLAPTGQRWERIPPVVGLPRACEAARADLKEVPAWTTLPRVQLPTACSFLHSNGHALLSTGHRAKRFHV